MASQITLADARTIISATLGHPRQSGMNPLCVVVLDAGGHLKAFEREDGVPNRRYEVAFGKAHGAISMGFNSRQLGEMAVERPHFMAGVAGALGGAVVPVAGGVIVEDDEGNAIGAVGVSGDTSDNDEIAAIAGINAAGLTARG